MQLLRTKEETGNPAMRDQAGLLQEADISPAAGEAWGERRPLLAAGKPQLTTALRPALQALHSRGLSTDVCSCAWND